MTSLSTTDVLIAMALLAAIALSGCARASTQTLTTAQTPSTTETPTAVVWRSNGDSVVASGEVVPAQKSHLGFAIGGRVHAVSIAEGDSVQPGDALVTLDTALAKSAVAQAHGALAEAEAQRAVLQAGPRLAEIAAAQAQLETAKANLAQAAAQRDQLVKSGDIEAEVAAARAQLARAQAEEQGTRIAYEQLRDRKVQDWEKEVALLRLRAAEQSRAAGEAQLTLTEKRGEVQVRAARAAVQTAAGQWNVAQAQLDLLQAGPSSEEVAAAEAAVDQAQAQLAAAQARLDQTMLQAPFAGTIAALNVDPGETVVPGQVVLALADLYRLQVETTDLSERDVAEVAVGQQATVFVEPLGVEVEGRVARIAPRATTIGGDVVYRVVVELDEQPAGLRWGMSVKVEIKVEVAAE